MKKSIPEMNLNGPGGNAPRIVAIPTLILLLLVLWCQAHAFDVFDLVPGVIEAPEFKGKDPIQKLRLVADLLRTNRVKQSDIAYVALDWADQYRETIGPA